MAMRVFYYLVGVEAETQEHADTLAEKVRRMKRESPRKAEVVRVRRYDGWGAEGELRGGE